MSSLYWVCFRFGSASSGDSRCQCADMLQQVAVYCKVMEKGKIATNSYGLDQEDCQG